MTSSSGSLGSCWEAFCAGVPPLPRIANPLEGGDGAKIALDSKMSRPLSFWFKTATG